MLLAKPIPEEEKPIVRRSYANLLAATILHLSVALSIFVAGRFSLMPAAFDVYGIGNFAGDSKVYRLDAISLVRILTHQGTGA